MITAPPPIRTTSSLPRGLLSRLVRHGTRTTDSNHASANFRPDIQGLRALAVGIVVLDHARIPGLSGGFVGVDVFFVISGFLITGLLLGDLAKHQKVRFLTFYARRAARILPAATVVIAVTAIASYLILGVLQARTVGVDSVWAVFFAANIRFAAAGTNYFAATSNATSPLQHFWSLAVEEQFYLVWPALLGLVAFSVRRVRATRGLALHVPRATIAVLLGCAFAGSLFLSVTQTVASPTAAYFSTIDRVWELSLGAMLAVALPWLGQLPRISKIVLSWSGLAAVLVAATTFTTHTLIPGYAALLPVLGCAAMLVGGIGLTRGTASGLLSIRPLRFIGDTSYSLYLWHWPILILGADYLGARDTIAVRVGLIAGALAVSALSYYGLENPLRRAKLLLARSWHAMVLWPLAVGAVLFVGLVAAPAVPFSSATGPVKAVPVPTAVATAVAAALSQAPIPHATSPSLAVAATDHVDLGACSAYRMLTSKICNYGDHKGTRTVVIFGNSHSVMWVPAIAKLAKFEHLRFYPVVKEACGYDTYTDVVPGLSPKNQCTQWYHWALTQIKRLHPDVIIMASYTATRYWLAGETTAITQLKPLAPRFILLSDTPTIPSPANCLTTTGATQKSCLWPESDKVRTHDTQSAAIAAAARVQYLDITNFFCNAASLCPSVINGLIPYYDGAHLTPQYSTYLASALAHALNLSGPNVITPVAVSISS